MDSVSIATSLMSNPHTREIFHGVYPSDNLPLHINYRPAIVLANLDPSFLGGSHWVNFWLPSHSNSVEFFRFSRK